MLYENGDGEIPNRLSVTIILIKMKSKNYLNNYAIWLLLALMLTSCSPKRLNFLEKPAEVVYKNNSLQSGEKTLFKTRPSDFSLRDESIILTQDSLSVNDIKYYSRVLKESAMATNDIIAIINKGSHHTIILLRKEGNAPEIDGQLYFSGGEWAGAPADFFEKTEYPTFGRKLFLFKKRKRIIVRDDFNDIHIVYVIQGIDKKSKGQARIFTWDPTRFNNFLSLASYINKEIDPVTKSVAINTK
ncbi:MAG: hypothetical protein IKI67_07385 [Bacteroidales bacterium]|nr:hypothetical protein [Bacteroidales bacterium]